MRAHMACTSNATGLRMACTSHGSRITQGILSRTTAQPEQQKSVRHRLAVWRMLRGKSQRGANAFYESEARQWNGARLCRDVHRGSGAKLHGDRKSTRLNSSHLGSSYAVF